VGLGNPGPKYAGSRHNIGFVAIDALAKSLDISNWTSSHRSVTAIGIIEGRDRCRERLILAKPQTFMNRSGSAVVELLRDHGAQPSDLIVVHDELDLELGRLRLKSKGGHGGHRGVESIIESLQTNHFFRLRIGIGRPAVHQEAVEKVLSVFLPDERSVVQTMIERSVAALECLIKEGPAAMMNRFHI